ncbi:MAG: hypothetical protein ACJA0Q_000721 [Saprospiraceae bacterium]|jgi:hypothetical protein
MGKPSTDFAFKLNKTMEEHSIRISYTGEFNTDLISVLLSMSRDSAKMGTVQIKVYNIMIESLENVVRHATVSVENPYPAIFLLAQDNEYHYVCTGNKIHQDHIPELKDKIDKVNNSSREELRASYNQIMVDGETPDDVKGAGLGLIDMALKSKSKLHYEFTPIDDLSSFFVLKIKVKS